MGVEVKNVVMLCCDVPVENTDADEFYDDIDDHSTWKRGEITYLYDGMCGKYFFVGEVLDYIDDMYDDFVCEINDEMYSMKNQVQKFCYEKFGINQEPKIRVINYVY